MERTVAFGKAMIRLWAWTIYTLTLAYGQTTPLPAVPKTVDEAAALLKTKRLHKQDLDWILRNPRDVVTFSLYQPFGTMLRNEFGLWSNNQELRDSCSTSNPEDCSSVILNRLWESVRAEAEPSLVEQLDCQFNLIEAIHVDQKGFYKLTTGELIQALQTQIDKELMRLKASGAAECVGSLTIDVAGDPNLRCFVEAAHVKRDNDKDRDIPLNLAAV